MRRFALVGLVVCGLLPGLVLAVFPVAVLPGVALVFESGAMAAGYAAAAAFVGAAIVGFSFSDASTVPSVPSSAPLVARLSPKAEVPTPEGWTPASAPGGDPVPPPAAPSPGYSPPAGAPTAKRCISYFDKYSTPPKWTSSCGSSETYAACENWMRSSGSSQGYQVWCFVNESQEAVSQNWPEGLNVVPVDKQKELDGKCPDGSAPVNGACASDPNQPFPPDGQVVVNAFGGRASVHPRDSGDAGRAGFSLGEGGGFAYKGGGMTGTFAPRPDGSASLVVEVVQPDGKVKKTIYDLESDGSGGYKLGGGSEGYIDGFGSGAGSGVDGSTGDAGSGAGSASCGGFGQPACEVDDSGFSGASAGSGLADSITAMDGVSDTVKAVENGDLGVSWSWLPTLTPGPSVACSPLLFQPSITRGPAAGLGGTYELDICDKLGTVRELIAWFFGLFTVFYVWRKFVNANGGMQ